MNPLKNYSYDVYLGGSLSSKSNWRSDVAIPLLKKHGLSYYNPAIRENVAILDNVTSNRIYQNGNTIEGEFAEGVPQWAGLRPTFLFCGRGVDDSRVGYQFWCRFKSI